MTSSSRSSRSSLSCGPRPGLPRAEHVALASLLEVEPGQLEAVERRGDAVEPLPGRACRGSAVVTSRQRPGCSPRPIRPRSWCSWEMPNRSASSTIIAVAFGDVDADLDHRGRDQDVDPSPAANRRITSSLTSAAAGRAAARRRSPASSPCAPASGATSSTAAVATRRLSAVVVGVARRRSAGTRRTPGVRPSTSSRARSQTRSEPVRLVRERDDGGGDRLPPGRQLAQRRGLEVAEHRHRNGARDRRRGHHEHVRRRRSPCSRSASRCSTPNRCCSSTTTRPRSKNCTVFSSRAWVPITMPGVARPRCRAAPRDGPPRSSTR